VKAKEGSNILAWASRALLGLKIVKPTSKKEHGQERTSDGRMYASL
jgi:hypothetical protein